MTKKIFSISKRRKGNGMDMVKIVKYLCVVGVVLGLAELVAYGQNTAGSAAATQPAVRDVAPPDCDFERLGLQVTSVEAVPSIHNQNSVLSPIAGRKFVVVHLKGKGKAPGNFIQASNWSDIQAVYGVPSHQGGGMGFAIEPACGFFIEELMGGAELWAFSKACQAGGMTIEGMSINGHPITSGGLIRVPDGEITVAFNLPAYVKAITLRYPVAAKDAAGAVVHEIR